MSHIRVNGLEGHYTIKRLKKLPKKGNANWLYTLEKDHMSVYYLWTLNNEYEKICIADSLSFATKIQAGNNIVITGTGTDLDPYIINAVPETAAETPVTPVGNIESTNVQDALEELQTDIDTISVQSDWDQTDNIQPDFIENKPTNTSDFTNDGSDGTSLYVEEDNPILPRIVSGLLDSNTGIATFIRDDSSNFSIDFSPLLVGSVTNTSDLINDGEDGTNPFITDQDIPQYTLDINANLLRLLRDGTVVSTEDLSLYLDDTNLARLVSGNLNNSTGVATFTRDDNSTFTVDFSALLGGNITVDDALSLTSDNPAENSIITTFLSLCNEELLKLSYNTRGNWKHDTLPRTSAAQISYDRDVIIANISGVDYQLTKRNSANMNNNTLPYILDDSGKKFYVSIYSDRFNLPYYFLNREFNFNYNLVSGGVTLTGLDPDYTANEIEFISPVPMGLTTNLSDPDRVLFSFILSDVSSSGSITIDDTLSNTSTNALENQEIENNFQIVSQNLSEQMRYRAPGRGINYYVHGSLISNNNVSTVPFATPVVWFAANGNRYMAVDDTNLNSLFFQAFFENSGGLVQAMFTRASTIFGTSIAYEERIAYNTLSTTPDTSLVNVPSNYTVFEVQNSYTLNYMLGVGDVTFADSPFMSFSWVRQAPTSSSGVQSVVAGTNVTVDNSDPNNPIVSAIASAGQTSGSIQNITIQDLGGGATYSIGGSASGNWRRIGDMVMFTFNVTQITMSGTPTGTLRVNVNDLPLVNSTNNMSAQIRRVTGTNMDIPNSTPVITTGANPAIIFVDKSTAAGSGLNLTRDNVTFPTGGSTGRVEIDGFYIAQP